MHLNRLCTCALVHLEQREREMKRDRERRQPSRGNEMAWKETERQTEDRELGPRVRAHFATGKH